MSSEEVCEAVKVGLAFVDGFVPAVTDNVLYSETVHPDQIYKDLHKKLRRTVPVPAIYTTLLILQRVAEMARLQKNAMDQGDSAALPKSKTHVDYTVKKIFTKWTSQVSKYVHQNCDFQDDSWDPLEAVVTVLEESARYNLNKFFGI